MEKARFLGMVRTCVIYQYFESNEVYKENLLHFLTFGYEADVDFYFVFCGEHSVKLPDVPNYYYVQTENKNRDFGGYSFAINNSINLEKYDYFIFLNASVRGPYLPCYAGKPWTEYFTSPLNDDVRLFGSTINILSNDNPVSSEFKHRHGGEGGFSHVQTMMFSIAYETLLFLKNIGFFTPRNHIDDYHVVTDYEILLSQLIVRNNWNFRCLLPEYNQIDYRAIHEDVNPTSNLGDTLFQNAYFGRTVHPYEVIFIKMNRQLYPHFFLQRLTFSLARAGIALPVEFHDHYISEYVKRIFLETDFHSELPSERHRLADRNLNEIIHVINQIITRPDNA